jgi:hypothetical protein
MSELVPADTIEQTVGAERHAVQHLARAVSAEQTVYVLHSHACNDSGIDLRECPYSAALDNGIDPSDWAGGYEDRTVVVAIIRDRLFPIVPPWLEEGATS